MAIKTLQVAQTGSAVQFSSTPIYAKWAIIQNNGAAVARVGDSAVTTTRGYSLTATGGALNVPVPFPATAINLADWWTVGTSTQLVDVVYDSETFS